MNTFREVCLWIGFGIMFSLLPTIGSAFSIGEFPVAPLTTSTSNAGVAAGLDGNVWFTAVVPNRIGRITPSGTVTSFSIEGFGMLTGGITVGPEGNVWFTKQFPGAIMRMTPGGSITEFLISKDSAGDITVGPDGNLWFTSNYSFGRITTDGNLTLIPQLDIMPGRIISGPDGNLWFTGRRYPPGEGLIARITPAGALTAFPIKMDDGPLAREVLPGSITAGPDGNLWFSYYAGIGRITTAGAVTLFQYPSSMGSPTSITTGPDGNLWFTDNSNSWVGRITSDGQYLVPFTETPSGVNHPQRITTSPDGLIWFYQSGNNTIGVVSPDDIAGYFPLSTGANWTYSVNGGAFSFTRTVDPGTTNINGVETTLFSESSGGGRYMTNDASGIREHREDDPSGDVTFKPAITFASVSGGLGSETFSSGRASGTVSGTPFSLRYNHSALIEGIETVTVPAGTFRAVRTTLSLTLFSGLEDVTTTETDWFAGGVGAVKAIEEADTYELTDTSLTVTTPDIFSYVVPSATPPITQNTFTVTGITAAAPINIVGGEYSVNGGPYTTASGSVTNGQSLEVRPTALVNPLVKQARVTIGGVTGVFNALVPAPPLTIPTIIHSDPAGGSINTAEEFKLSVTATGENLEFQWRLDGVEVSGATISTYIDPENPFVSGATVSTCTIPCAQRFHSGEYTVVVSNSGGSVTSSPTVLEVEPPPKSDSRLMNLSTRAISLTGNNVLIPGFVISGTGSKTLLIRSVGATLRKDPFNIPTALENPHMMLKWWNGSVFEDVASNDDWETNTNAAEISRTTMDLGAFALTDEKDAALLATLDAGRYTVVAGGVENLTGVAIVELFDADGDKPATVLANISNRGFVGTGASIMIPGLVVSAPGPKTFLIRAVGPALGESPFNLSGVLEDPVMTVYSGETPILWNDNWVDNPDAAYTAQIASQLGAFALPEGSKDSAFVVSLPQGSFTIQAEGIGGATGTAIVEVYLVE